MGSISIYSGCARFGPILSIEESSIDVVKRALAQNYKRLRSFDGVGNLTVESPTEALTANASVLIKNPDSVYVKLEVAWGMDVGLLFADKDSFTIYTPMQNIYYTGKTVELNLEYFINFHVSYDQLLRVLAGLEPATELRDGKLIRQDSHLILGGYYGEHKVVHWIDPEHGVVTETQLFDPQNELTLKAEYERFKRIDGVHLPQTIRITRPIMKEKLTLFYRDIRINKDINPKKFRVNVPASATKIRL
jgi:outer membrane lipoprotein-sorting protein